MQKDGLDQSEHIDNLERNLRTGMVMSNELTLELVKEARHQSQCAEEERHARRSAEMDLANADARIMRITAACALSDEEAHAYAKSGCVADSDRELFVLGGVVQRIKEEVDGNV